MGTTKELSEKTDLAIAKVFYLSLLINRHSKRCVFLDMQGHVSTIILRILESKKDYNFMPVKTEFNYDNSKEYTWNIDSKERLSNINDITELLEKICVEDKIPYDWCRAVEEVTSYSY